LPFEHAANARGTDTSRAAKRTWRCIEVLLSGIAGGVGGTRYSEQTLGGPELAVKDSGINAVALSAAALVAGELVQLHHPMGFKVGG
jgi:hypothetical protein